MRLIGGRDYYDNGLAFGRDDTITFVRHRADLPEHTQEGLIPGLPLGDEVGVVGGNKCIWNRVERNGIKTRKIVVILAGKRYSGYRLVDPNMKFHHFWSLADMTNFLDRVGMWIPTKYRWRWRDKDETSEYERAEAWFNNTDLPRETHEWIMEKRATIVFATYNPIKDYSTGWIRHGRKADPYEIQIDTDCLKGLDFFRKLDPVQAFQEIQMWVGGTLPRPGPPMVEITDDKMKAAKHGMDKWSFRKMPEKK